MEGQRPQVGLFKGIESAYMSARVCKSYGHAFRGRGRGRLRRCWALVVGRLFDALASAQGAGVSACGQPLNLSELVN